MLKQATRVILTAAVFGMFATAAANAQDAVPPVPQDLLQTVPGQQVAPAMTDANGWGAYLQDPYYGTAERPYGSATTIYYPWPGIPYYGPRYYGFRPSWFGAGHPTSDFAGFGW